LPYSPGHGDDVEEQKLDEGEAVGLQDANALSAEHQRSTAVNSSAIQPISKPVATTCAV
jgi:hypothetical protein